jgi:hypothetical protein
VRVLLPLSGGPLAEIGTEAFDRAGMAPGSAGRADVLTMENKRDVEAKGRPLGNEPIKKKHLWSVTVFLNPVFAGKETKTGQHTVAVDISGKYVATERVEHHRSSRFRPHATDRAEKLQTPPVDPLAERVERDLTETGLNLAKCNMNFTGSRPAHTERAEREGHHIDALVDKPSPIGLSLIAFHQ